MFHKRYPYRTQDARYIQKSPIIIKSVSKLISYELLVKPIEQLNALLKAPITTIEQARQIYAVVDNYLAQYIKMQKKLFKEHVVCLSIAQQLHFDSLSIDAVQLKKIKSAAKKYISDDKIAKTKLKNELKNHEVYFITHMNPSPSQTSTAINHSFNEQNAVTKSTRTPI